jgi:hypothetical protein
LPTASVTTSTSGTWSTSLAVPAGTDTGDYAVTATCSVGGAVTSSYDAEPLALGTVRIGPATCGARSAFAPLTGTYTGDLAGKGDVSLPSKFPLNGDGPWKISLRSATTGQVLAARTVSCAKLRYELGTTKPGLSDANKPRVRVCNTGRSPVTAILKLWKGKEFQKADAEVLDAGECVWLEGPRLDKGGQAKAQVLIDAPGKGSDDVVETFTVKRPKR